MKIVGKGPRGKTLAPMSVVKSTTKYDLHYLVDRKGYGKGIMYKVLWMAPSGRCPRTWEPKADLLEDDPSLQDEMGVVDRWFASGQTQSLHKFMQEDEYGQTLLTANDDETCAFVAIRTAAKLIGYPDIYSEAEYERFMSDSARHQVKGRARSNEDQDGITSKALTAFVKGLVERGAPLDLPAFMENRHKTGNLHAGAINKLGLENGVYVVGAKKLNTVAHAFALVVKDGSHVVHDDGVIKPLDEYGGWIVRLMFVRKFQAAYAY